MKTTVVMTLAAVAATAAAGAVQIEPGLGEKMTVPCVYTNAAGKTFNYRWHEPAKMEDWKRYPLTIWAKGKRIRVLLNGVEVQNANLDDYKSIDNPDGTVVPPWQRNQPFWCNIPTKGKIGFQGKHGPTDWYVWYARIRPLTDADTF